MPDPPLKWRETEDQGLLVRSGSVSDIDELTDDSGDSLYTSCINDHQREQHVSSITDPCIPVSTMKRTSTPTENLLQPTEVKCSPEKGTSLIYTNEKEQDMNRNFSNSCGCTINLDPHCEPSTPSACVGSSLGKIIESLKTHLAEFQNSSNDSWTMREANFCLRTLREMLDMLEKMDCFNQKYHSFVMNFNRHMLAILHLNVDSLLLSMTAYIRCASSLQPSQHSGGIALYPEELIQMMGVLIEQSIRAVNTAWVTFLQSTHSQIDEFSARQHPQASPLIQKPLGCENKLKEDGQAESLSAKEAVCSPEESRKTETPCEEMQTVESKNYAGPMCECREDVEHLVAGLSSPSHTVSCSTYGQECGQPESDKSILQVTNCSPSQQKTGDKPSGQPLFGLRECFVPLEKISDNILPRKPNNQKLSDMEILSHHSMCDPSPTVQDYTLSGGRRVNERNPLKQHTKPASKEREMRKQKISKPTSKHKGSDVQKSFKPSVTRFDISPGHKSKTDRRKPLNRCEEDEPCSGASPQVLCTERGTQTPSRLHAHKTSGTSVNNRSLVPRVQSGSCGKDPDKERRSRSSTSTCSPDDHENRTKKTPGSSKSWLNDCSSDNKESKKSKKKLFPDLKEDSNLSRKKEKRLKDHLGLTTFVSSVKSYKCSPTAVHVSLQVSCVERNVLARKLSFEATKQLEKKKAKDRSRKRAMEARRMEKSRIGSTSRNSLEEKNSSTPRKRLKSADDALIMKNYYYNEVNAKSSRQKKDSNNNAMQNNLSKVNQLHSEQVKFHSLYVDNSFVPRDPSNLQGRTSGSSKGCKGDNSQVRTTCIMLEDEEHFFLNRQAELTAKIKRMRKKKARGVDPGSSTPNTNKGQTDNEDRTAPKFTDSNNNVVP